MATSAEHKTAAEAALAEADAEITWTEKHATLLRAQVHATLATLPA